MPVAPPRLTSARPAPRQGPARACADQGPRSHVRSREEDARLSHARRDAQWRIVQSDSNRIESDLIKIGRAGGPDDECAAPVSLCLKSKYKIQFSWRVEKWMWSSRLVAVAPDRTRTGPDRTGPNVSTLCDWWARAVTSNVESVFLATVVSTGGVFIALLSAVFILCVLVNLWSFFS